MTKEETYRKQITALGIENHRLKLELERFENLANVIDKNLSIPKFDGDNLYQRIATQFMSLLIALKKREGERV